MTEWKKYQHIVRLDNEEVEGILDMPNVWVEPKLDGSNASLFMEEGQLKVAKRSKILDEGDDFRGLKSWVEANELKFKGFFDKHPDTIIFGEWLVKHTVSWYKKDAMKQFYAYDIQDTRTYKFLSPEIKNLRFDAFFIKHVPSMQLDTTDKIKEQLEHYVENNKYLIEESEPRVGEGIVIKSFDNNGEPYTNKYGRTQWAKIVRPQFKEQTRIKKPQVKDDPEILFVEQFVTPARIEKIKQKIMTDMDTGWQCKYIGQLMGRVWHDIFEEELWGFVKKEKVKKFDFKLANNLCTCKIKEVIGL